MSKSMFTLLVFSLAAQPPSVAGSEAPPCELCGLGRLSAEGQVNVTGHYTYATATAGTSA